MRPIATHYKTVRRPRHRVKRQFSLEEYDKIVDKCLSGIESTPFDWENYAKLVEQYPQLTLTPTPMVDNEISEKLGRLSLIDTAILWKSTGPF